MKNISINLIKRLLLVLGLLDAVYLTYIKYSSDAALCTTGCDIVNSSAYSEIMGIPIAILGGLTYLFLLGLEFAIDRKPDWITQLQLVSFATSLFGFLYQAYLTYVEIFILNAICQYCVISAVIMTTILIINLVTVLKQPLD